MRILLASDAYKNKMVNGAAGVVENLAETLTACGHEVKILTMSSTNEAVRTENEYFLPSFPMFHYPGFRQTLLVSHPYISELKKWKPDIVHAHTEGSAARIARYIAGSAKAPFLMTMHTYYAKFAFHQFGDTWPVRLLCVFLAAFYYRGARIVTTPSKKGKLLLEQYKYRHEIRVIPNGIDLERFRKEYTSEERAATFKELGIPDNGKLFVVISRLSAEKSVSEIIKAFAEVAKKDKDTHLLMVGDGPDMHHLIRLSKSLHVSDRVIFTGRKPQEELYRYYKSGFAFLSASDFEMHSLTYLEAMACGLPLICKDDPCLAGVLKNNVNGFTFKKKEEFPEKMLELLNNKQLQKQFSEASLKRSAYFGEYRCARRMLALYEEIRG